MIPCTRTARRSRCAARRRLVTPKAIPVSAVVSEGPKRINTGYCCTCIHTCSRYTVVVVVVVVVVVKD